MTAAETFEFGAVLTATEMEGCSPAADWSRWISKGKAPNSARDSIAGNGFSESWPEDLEQLAALGVTSVMLTMEWAELEPHPGRPDQTAIEFRRDLLTKAQSLGLSPWLCLVDGTLPGWFADDEGGFLDDNARNLLWPRHIDWIGETFGDLAAGWIPQREPLHWALRRYLRAEAPPGKRDLMTAAKATQAAMLAEGEAWRLLRGTAPVATYQTARSIYAKPDDVKAKPLAAGLERLLWHPWLTSLTEGRLVVGSLPERQVDHLRDAFDRVIVELRPSIQVDGQGGWHPHPADQVPGPTGWTAWPQAQAEALHRVTDEMEGREIVAVGSLADVTDDGRARADHQQAMMEVALEAGVAGWWQASPFDGYHFNHGFALQPGLVSMDRTESDAAHKFTEIAKR